MTGVEHGRTRQADPEPIAVVPPKGWVRRLWGYLLLHRSDVTISLIAAILSSVCLAVVPLIERQIVNGVILKRNSALWPWLTVLLVIAAVAFVLSHLRRYHGAKVALAVQLDLRNAIHDHLQQMDFENLDRMPTGQLVSPRTPTPRSSRHS